MDWFKKIFSQEKKQKFQQFIKPDAHDFTAVLQVIGEEAIMATAYWLVKLVKQGLEPKAPSQGEPPANPGVNHITVVEELLPKVVSLIEKSDQRSQAVMILESRIGAIEVVGDSHSTELDRASQAMAALENRIVNLERLLEDGDILTEKVGQASQNLTALEKRVANVENLLSRFSIVPKLVERQDRAIATLQNRLAALESSEDTSQENSSESKYLAIIQPDSVHYCSDHQ